MSIGEREDDADTSESELSVDGVPSRRVGERTRPLTGLEEPPPGDGDGDTTDTTDTTDTATGSSTEEGTSGDPPIGEDGDGGCACSWGGRPAAPAAAPLLLLLALVRRRA